MLIASSSLLAWSPQAATSTLDFDSFQGVLANYDDIPGTYGDNLPNTPNVTVEYRTVVPATGATHANNVEYWQSSYSDLQNVAFPTVNGYFGEISLIAAPGYTVDLHSFVLGGYPSADQPNQTVRILDGAYNIVEDYSPFNVEGNSGHSTFIPSLPGMSVVRIQWGPSWNAGIDNIVFSQADTSAVPDAASSMALLGLASGALALARRFAR